MVLLVAGSIATRTTAALSGATLARKDFVRRKAPAVEAFARLAGSRDPILQGKLFGSAFQSGFFG